MTPLHEQRTHGVGRMPRGAERAGRSHRLVTVCYRENTCEVMNPAAGEAFRISGPVGALVVLLHNRRYDRRQQTAKPVVLPDVFSAPARVRPYLEVLLLRERAPLRHELVWQAIHARVVQQAADTHGARRGFAEAMPVGEEHRQFRHVSDMGREVAAIPAHFKIQRRQRILLHCRIHIGDQ